MTFEERVRFTTLLAGIAFFAVGVFMVIMGVSAEGVIDLKSTFASGSLKTGSAGLFVLFFSFFLIMTALLFRRKEEVKTPNRGGSIKTALGVFLLLVGLATACGFATVQFEKSFGSFVFFMGAFAAGFGALGALIVLLNAVEENGKQ